MSNATALFGLPAASVVISDSISAKKGEIPSSDIIRVELNDYLKFGVPAQDISLAKAN